MARDGGGEVKALSIRQPWAWAIMHAGKRVENREWQPGGGNEAQARRLIGQTILLHAGKGCTQDEYDDARFSIRESGVFKAEVTPLAFLPRGALVARARLVDVVGTTGGAHRLGAPPGSATCLLCGDVGLAERLTCPKADLWAIPGCLGLVLADVEALPSPVTFKGALGFFEVPAEVCR